jgi:flagellar motor switch/type III secretory pathway protein FliN
LQHLDEAAVHTAPVWRSSRQTDVENLSVAGEYSGLTLRAVFADRFSLPTDGHQFDCCLTGTAGLHEFTVGFSKAKADAALNKLIAGAYLSLDGNARDIVFLTHLASPFLDAYEALGLGPIQFVTVSKQLENTNGPAQILNIEDQSRAARGQLAIYGNDAFFAAISSAFATVETASIETKHLRMEVALVAGVVGISLAEARKLSAGQGVYLDYAPVDDGRLLISTGNGQFLQATIDGHLAIITGGAPMKSPFDAPTFVPFSEPQGLNQMPGGGFAPDGSNIVPLHSPMAPDRGSIVDVQDISLQMMVEVARYDLTVSEVSALKAGSSFDIPADPKKLVTLRIGNQVIGYGEIVQAGHKLAVRITEMKA